MDFALAMLLVLVVTGAIMAFDRWVWAPARRRRIVEMSRTGSTEAKNKAGKEPAIVEYARAFFPVILVVFLIRSFLAEPFRIPSGSMLPSLHIGDFILVNKFSYGIRLPVANVKLVGLGAPHRGEVAVFRFPSDPSINYIKRVVGVPGDHVVYKDKQLTINGVPMKQEDARAYALFHTEAGTGMLVRRVEDLDGARHDILLSDRPDHGPDTFTVPPGQYFVMGDNRDQSNDSRYWGFVPDENLVGRAFLIWFSWDAQSSERWFWQRIVWNRIGDTIH
ncbi:MAG TPA: signal peptidase I [Burkholderiales bacterium]|nr:signal peptidase I [Burkholderiales bacterium]